MRSAAHRPRRRAQTPSIQLGHKLNVTPCLSFLCQAIEFVCLCRTERIELRGKPRNRQEVMQRCPLPTTKHDGIKLLGGMSRLADRARHNIRVTRLLQSNPFRVSVAGKDARRCCQLSRFFQRQIVLVWIDLAACLPPRAGPPAIAKAVYCLLD